MSESAVRVAIGSVSSGEKFARFTPEAGKSDFFRRYLGPYGRRAGAEFFVPLPAALRACGALQARGVTLRAASGIPEAMKGASWSCKVPGLYPYQRSGAEFLRSRRRALLADQMGTGKTNQALSAIDERYGALIVVPNIVIGNWYKEARRWRPDLNVRLWQRPYPIFPDPGEVNLVTYPQLPKECLEARARCPFCNRLSCVMLEDEEILALSKVGKNWTERCDPERGGNCRAAGIDGQPGELRARRFKRNGEAYPEWVWTGDKPKGPIQLVVDEAHYCKTKTSQRAIAVRTIASQCASVWLLTGTPLLNQPPELWSLCELFPGQGGAFDNGAWDTFGSWSEFVEMFEGKKNYVGGKPRGYEWKPGAATPEARERLGAVMLRRMRAEVLPDLPVKTRRVIDVHVNERQLSKLVTMTDSHYLHFAEWSDDKVLEECAPGGALSTIRKELAALKLDPLIELIKEAEQVEEPVIAFSYHRGPVLELGARKGWACITGSTTDQERTSLVEKFQKGQLRGIAGTIGAMGVGVTLTRSASVMFLDRDFVPANNLQGEDRAVRIGQTRGVIVTVLNATHPVDQRVSIILDRKEKLLEAMNLSEESVSA